MVDTVYPLDTGRPQSTDHLRGQGLGVLDSRRQLSTTLSTFYLACQARALDGSLMAQMRARRGLCRSLETLAFCKCFCIWALRGPQAAMQAGVLALRARIVCFVIPVMRRLPHDKAERTDCALQPGPKMS